MNEYYGVASTSTDDFLAHYGVKGMKWGVRRYQNSDGRYTENGKNRAYALRNRQAIENIYSSFSNKDKKLLDAGGAIMSI